MEITGKETLKGYSVEHFLALAIASLLVIAGLWLFSYVTGCEGQFDTCKIDDYWADKRIYDYRIFGLLVGLVGFALATATIRDARKWIPSKSHH